MKNIWKAQDNAKFNTDTTKKNQFKYFMETGAVIKHDRHHSRIPVYLPRRQ